MAYMIFIIPVKGASPVGTVRLVDVHIMFILRMYVPVKFERTLYDSSRYIVS